MSFSCKFCMWYKFSFCHEILPSNHEFTIDRMWYIQSFFCNSLGIISPKGVFNYWEFNSIVKKQKHINTQNRGAERERVCTSGVLLG